MHHAKSFLLASVAIAMVSGPQAFAAPHASPPLVLAQAGADVPEAVTTAEAKVTAARADLQKATASGQGVKEARQALRAALKELNDARVAAGLPPANQEPAAAEAPPPADQPPPAEAKAPPQPAQPPAAEAKTPPPTEQAPAEQAKTPAPPDQTQPAAEAQPPATQQQKPATAEAPRKLRKPPPAEAKAPPQPAQAPAAEAKTPPPDQQQQPPAAEAQPPADQQQKPATAEAPRKLRKPPPAEAKAPPTPEQKPAEAAKAPPPAAKAPAPQTAAEQPAASPPPATMDNGQPPPKFNPQMLKQPHPRFGEAPKQDQNVQLPKQEAQIPKGGEVNAGAGRTIVKEDNGQVTVRHDDTARFQRLGGNANVQQGRDGTTTTTVTRPDGVQVVTVKDRNGNILQRYRKDRNGQIEVLIGQTEPQRNGRQPPPPPKPEPKASFDFHINLPPLKLTIPQDQYVVESSKASRQQLTRTFEAPPVEKVERPYSLEEIRRSDRVRNMVRRVDFDTVNFEFGSAVLPDDQIPKMQAVGEAMQDVLKRDPGQVFLIEGHTDAVGSDLANLALSDRRAETVAEILTYYFGIPPENLVTQGYGEQYLKVPTNGPERANRRVVFRNITPLMRTGSR